MTLRISPINLFHVNSLKQTQNHPLQEKEISGKKVSFSGVGKIFYSSENIVSTAPYELMDGMFKELKKIKNDDIRNFLKSILTTKTITDNPILIDGYKIEPLANSRYTTSFPSLRKINTSEISYTYKSYDKKILDLITLADNQHNYLQLHFTNKGKPSSAYVYLEKLKEYPSHIYFDKNGKVQIIDTKCGNRCFFDKKGEIVYVVYQKTLATYLHFFMNKKNVQIEDLPGVRSRNFVLDNYMWTLINS